MEVEDRGTEMVATVPWLNPDAEGSLVENNTLPLLLPLSLLIANLAGSPGKKLWGQVPGQVLGRRGIGASTRNNDLDQLVMPDPGGP